ncbi:PepSY domain-containing protein [Azonexus sp.]|jgi:uncharacterized membrane protein YkoI|uniref:PepSY domain-containing protein n=1 Tax=Azonexus sp. TaxID=1872668 RepID=UPI00282C5B0A|nr:PepSY domain-containing protein [Azonexus sp.]MDR1994525.1 hypothetical protein [Azonexus sp.]
MERKHPASPLIGLALLAALVAPAVGDDRRDHELAREELAAGRILPLRTVLDRIRPNFPGEVLEVELDDEHGRWVYAIKILNANGGVSKLLVDARDASLIRVRNRHDRH